MSYLGVDVGSLFVGLVQVDKDGNIEKQEYVRHQGEPLEAVCETLKTFDLDRVRGVVRTGSSGEALPLQGQFINALVAGVEGVKHLVPGARNIIYIGGGSFSLTRLNEDGTYQSSTVNSACASGTGAFLDQQSLRLQIPPTELSQRAMEYDKRPPGVATRCAVFAKSDMIHLQQEGFSVEAIAAGLCTGLGHSTVDGLLGGHTLSGKTAVIGGVARNSVVVNAVRERLNTVVDVPENPELVGAYGAAMQAKHNDDGSTVDLAAFAAAGKNEEGDSYLRPPLKLELSQYPSFEWHDQWLNEDSSEIAIVTPQSGTVEVSLGIDIGSTSTKGTLLDNDNKVVGWIYRKTAGNPIKATQLLLKAIREMEERGGFTFDVKGVGTTGSGRKMIGQVIGADLAMNEITAHAQAAIFIDPEVDTILELGGQDAKFTQLQNGMVYNSIMNYVCAAGTGSFIEEQALKLDIPLKDYADAAMGKECPKTSDRCTVYMERDLDLMLAKGYNKDAIAAAVLHSVRDNYLNKVVGGLYIGEHIYFQGATARNKALVAAFEVELGKPIKVSPYCHLTGALGMSLLVRDRIAAEDRSANFKGLDFYKEEISVDYEVCELCHNLCNLSLIHMGGGQTVAWGLKCGRDYESQKVKVKKVTTYDYWKQRETAWAKPFVDKKADGRPKIGVQRSLGTYGYWPYWSAFLNELGCHGVLSHRSSDATLHKGVEVETAEFCAPVAMAHGHARVLLEDESMDYVLSPYMLREPVPAGFTDAHFCCYVQSHAGILKSLKGLEHKEKILSPVVQFNQPVEYQVKRLAETLAGPLGVTEADLERGVKAGQQAMKDFGATAKRLGKEAMDRIEQENTLGLVCIGRPYNTTDAGLTLDLPRKMAELGYVVLFQDMLPYDLNSILPDYANMYWHYGQKILASAKYVAGHKRLFPVYFTNFMCGPDSYIQSYFKEIMGEVGKPYLCLQFDGHGADAGYLTRVEAALESFHSWSKIPRPADAVQNEEAAVQA